MAGMGLGAFLSGAAQGMQQGQRFKEYRDKKQDGGSSGAAIDAAALNQPIGFSGENYVPGQRLMENEADRGRQIEEDRQRNIENMRASSMAGGGQEQSQGMGIDPQMALSIYGKFAGSGSASGSGSAAGSQSSGLGLGSLFGGGSSAASAGGGTAAGSSAAGGSAAGGAAAGGSAVGGGSAASGMGSLGAAGPWGALAAIIIGNERWAKNTGYRREGTQYWKDLIGGKVAEQDTNQRWVPKIFGGYDDDKIGMAHDAGGWAEFSTLDFKNGARKMEDGTAGTLVKGIGKGIGKLFK